MAKKKLAPKSPFSLKIGTPTKETLVEDGSEFLKVPYQILEGKELFYEGSEGFPLNTPAADIQAVMEKRLVTLRSELEQKEASKGRDEAHAVADDAIAKIKDKVIKEK